MVSLTALELSRSRSVRITGVALALLVAAPLRAAEASPAATEVANAELDRFFAAEERAGAALDPIGSLERGEPVRADQLRLLYTPSLAARRRALNARSLARLAQFAADRLDPAHRISLDVFRAMKLEERDELRPEIESITSVQPFDHFGGFHIEYAGIASGAGAQPFRTITDYEATLARNKAFATVLDNAIARFREGLAGRQTEPRLTVQNMIAQIDGLLAQPIDKSPFLEPVAAFPKSFDAATRARLASDYRTVLTRDVLPAYRRLRAFLHDEYLPAARTSVGLSAMPGGPALYRQLVRTHTTLDMPPAQIHQLGLDEVARIHAEMDGIKAQMGFIGQLSAFFDHIRNDPLYHPKNAGQLSDGFRRVGRAVDDAAPRYFLHTPRTPLSIQAYPEYRAKFEAGGSYSEGSADGSRPGTFFYNTYDLKSRFLTGVTTLYLHEGAPGHHFQISLAQENESLPDFQRFGGNTAYVEGWALYAETLGYEMGMYKDPWQHWGTLDDEILRAMRLVVDTGLHTKNWSREQAIDYMLANSGMGRSDATAEVERYIANPGQALAYKLGALTIQRLRKQSEAALGQRFDIRQFHEEVLDSGALPLPVLQAKIERWIARGGGGSISAVR
jgi:uncharacterized protein (DUF885 family)